MAKIQIVIEVETDTTLSSLERQLVLRDALSEFVGKRVGFPDDDSLLRIRATQYVEGRYEGQSPEFRARKIVEVLARCNYANALHAAISTTDDQYREAKGKPLSKT